MRKRAERDDAHVVACDGKGPMRRTEARRPADSKTTREMTVIAQDPSVRTAGGARILMSKVSIPAEVLEPGPRGYRVHVVDYDATTGRYHGLHALPARYQDEPGKWQKGDPSIVRDYAFHAQNVYALVMKTLARFESALGRRIGWSFGSHQLNVAPHAMVDANAFYSPDDQGLVFCYFDGSEGKPIHTCLSHDVVVHETTHVLLDALRSKYMLPSSADQAAFHEGYADVIALLSIFSQHEIVEELLCRDDPGALKSRTLGPASVEVEALKQSALFGLAEEMGTGMSKDIQDARGGALRRSVTLPPDRQILESAEFEEPHRRGEVFAAAVMNVFVAIWHERLVGRAPHDGLGTLAGGRYSLRRVAEEGSAVADQLATMLIRAIDYMPPVHVCFGDVLSAVLTSDYEIRPDDSRYGVRQHLIDGFAAYGIAPASDRRDIPGVWKSPAGELSYGRVHFESMKNDPDEVFRFMWENRSVLRFNTEAYTRVLSVRPCVRVASDGFTLRETVAEYYQVMTLTLDELRERGIKVPAGLATLLRKAPRQKPSDSADVEGPDDEASGIGNIKAGTVALQGGGVLIFDEYGRLKYEVWNSVLDRKRQSARLADLYRFGYFRETRGRLAVNLRAPAISAMHRLRSLDRTQMPGEGW
jgi:hypothetical protein